MSFHAELNGAYRPKIARRERQDRRHRTLTAGICIPSLAHYGTTAFPRKLILATAGESHVMGSRGVSASTGARSTEGHVHLGLARCDGELPKSAIPTS